MKPLSQKTHDISFAVFRCAAIMSNSQLRKELESAAINLVATLDIKNSLEIQNSKFGVTPIDLLERLITFAESIGEMKTVNASVLRRELNNLQTAINEAIQTAKAKAEEETRINTDKSNLDISQMFTTLDTPSKQGIRPSNIKNSLEIQNSKLEIKPEIQVAESQNKQAISNRQEQILRFVREIPFCRLRNILEVMPEVSERTIRNDIQSLIEKQLVKRIGGGGPNSYFESLEITLPKPNRFPTTTI